MGKILVIEDDDNIRANVLDLLEAEGFEGIGARDGQSGVELAVRELPAMIICDVAMPGIDGFEVLEILSMKPATAAIPFVFLTARAERANVRRGMALGADDYITKPFTRAELLEAIVSRLKRRKALDAAAEEAARAQRAPASPTTAQAPRADLIVADPAMKAIFGQIEKIARAPISVLILGETGVGKEIIAEQIHRQSGRNGRFVALNCAALAETLLESELFGHEKGSFTGAVQTKEGLFEAADVAPGLPQRQGLRVTGHRPVGGGDPGHGGHAVVRGASHHGWLLPRATGHVRPGRRRAPLDGQPRPGQAGQHGARLQRLQRDGRVPRHPLHGPAER